MENTSLVYSYAHDGQYETKFINHSIVNKFEQAVGIEVTLGISVYIIATYQEAVDFVLRDLEAAELKTSVPGNFIAYDAKLLIEGNVDPTNPFEKINRSCAATIHGSYPVVEATYQRLRLYEKKNKQTVVHWWFKSDDKIKSVQFSLNNTDVFRPEFYPWIDNIQELFKRFNDSRENILILLGDPGTGKTSFVRHLIKSTNEHCYTTYDDDVMGSDEIYISFLSDRNAKYLVLEDADLLLTERVHSNNKVMSKMLNASDGLVSFKDKKLIFTANSKDKKKIDDALVRPGRCFDIIEFRRLNNNEAINAARVAGLELASPIRADYSLAEIFNGA
jgi:hypothetical protein